MKPRLLDLFCGAGGAAMGYHRAGFEVVGVDIKPQPRYPFQFHQADAFEFLDDLVSSQRIHGWAGGYGYDAIHASPPCQAYSVGAARWRSNGHKYPDLLDGTRERLVAAGVPYVIENVEGARKRMREPFRLCGQTFGIGVVRHRLFEANWLCLTPFHVPCSGAVQRDLVSVTGHGTAGRHYRAVTVAGHGGNSRSFALSTWKDAMGIDWMTRDELTQAIPPAYTEYIGRELMRVVAAQKEGESMFAKYEAHSICAGCKGCVPIRGRGATIWCAACAEKLTAVGVGFEEKRKALRALAKLRDEAPLFDLKPYTSFHRKHGA